MFTHSIQYLTSGDASPEGHIAKGRGGTYRGWPNFRGVKLRSRMFFCILFSGLECVGHSFAYVVHFVFLGDVWIRTQKAAIASWRATNLVL